MLRSAASWMMMRMTQRTVLVALLLFVSNRGGVDGPVYNGDAPSSNALGFQQSAASKDFDLRIMACLGEDCLAFC